ncbi:MAG: c-type cytochrome [Gemmatimonadaceae bacterium]|nr:c-type cytochrome [Acetobacteraceae bacterium]
MAAAQIAPPVSDAPDGAVLFRRQCAVCHSLNPTDPARVGPHLAGVMGRTAGSVAGYAYSPGLAAGGFAWDEERLDPYLTNPQGMIAGGKMSYRQANPAIRRAIIDYLKEQS